MTLPFFILLALYTPPTDQKVLVYEDKVYEPQIRSVVCYPLSGGSMMSSAARFDEQNLLLEFDDLQEQKNSYYVKLLHCNFDWTRSNLMDLDIMRDYNEFVINDYSYSVNTHIPFVHYRAVIPQVKIPGNYLIIVYRDGEKEDLILSKRVMVYNGRLTIAQTDDLSGLGNIRSTNQALNFTVNYNNVEIINPLANLHVTVRQNLRWDNARPDVKPSFVREDISQLEYRFFDMDKTFQGGNEFRFVDFRSLNYPGQNTYQLDKTRKPYTLIVAQDAPRGDQSYAQYTDLDGNYYVDNKDYPQEPWITSNYLNVRFTLKANPVKGDVYVIGAFNNWARNDENKMTFNTSLGAYTSTLLLKQGFYNYEYWVVGPGDAYQIEGSHFETENVYEVLVYYRAFQPNADMLIGYYVIPVNPR